MSRQESRIVNKHQQTDRNWTIPKWHKKKTLESEPLHSTLFPSDWHKQPAGNLRKESPGSLAAKVSARKPWEPPLRLFPASLLMVQKSCHQLILVGSRLPIILPNVWYIQTVVGWPWDFWTINRISTHKVWPTQLFHGSFRASSWTRPFLSHSWARGASPVWVVYVV